MFWLKLKRSEQLSDQLSFCYSVGWGCRIHWLHLCREVRPSSPKEFPVYDIKQSDDESLVMLELLGMPSLPDPLWPWVVAPDRVLPMIQIELLDIQTECKQMNYIKSNCLK